MSQLRATRELYTETGDSIYLAVIDAHLRTIAEVDANRKLADERRSALLQALREQEELIRAAESRNEMQMTATE